MRVFILSLCLCLCLLHNSRAQNSFNIELLFHWDDSTLTSTFAHDNVYNDIWGYAQQGKEYAIIGSTKGVHIFDITDPSNAYQAEFIMGRDTGVAIIHRDYHTYQHYLYAVSDEGDASLQIIDLSFLPDSAPLVYDSNIVTRIHNIFIDTLHAKLYTADGSGLGIFDISQPTNPTHLHTIGHSTHDVFVHNDTAYLNLGGSGLYVYDVSVVTSPELIGLLDSYPDKGYNHSGWLNPHTNLYVMADETHGMQMKLLDMSDVGNIEVLSLMHSNVDSLSIHHNQIIKGHIVYDAHYHDGFYAFDVSDPENPTVLGYYDTSSEPHAPNYRGAWGIYPFLPSGNIIVSDMQNGLFVFKFTNPPTFVDKILREFDVKVFPNPSADFITIDAQKALCSIEILDQNNRVVFQNNVGQKNKTTLDLREFSKGVYLLNVKSQDNRTQTRAIIVR